MIRAIFEDIAATPLREATEQDRLRVLADLDELPWRSAREPASSCSTRDIKVGRDAEGGIA